MAAKTPKPRTPWVDAGPICTECFWPMNSIGHAAAPHKRKATQ